MTVIDTRVMTLLSGNWNPPDEFDEFRIVRLLGSGAMGQVYLARDLLLDRPVAVKFVHAAGDPIARARVLEEARAIARLQHPNVVAIYRVAEVTGHPYLVSEYVHGQALSELERPMAWRQVLDIGLDLTRGLAAAHRRGVLHRDVKPANAVLTEDGRAKLLDFGLATIMENGPTGEVVVDAAPARDRVALGSGNRLPQLDGRGLPPAGSAVEGQRGSIDDSDATDATLPLESDETGSSAEAASNSRNGSRTSTGQTQVGTPMYMAPEIWRGEPASRRSDLYSLGVLLYELLTGAAPHRDVPLPALASMVQERDAPPVLEAAGSSESGGAIEPALAAIVDRLVARDPAVRFASADALLVALEEIATPTPAVAGNPYRGLAAFESVHAAQFFGRRGEIRELADRVRTEAFVVVGGDSGTGKSSLCRAGVLPELAREGWSCVEVVPGRHPVQVVAAAFAGWIDGNEAALVAALSDSPDAFARAIRARIVAGEQAQPRRLLLFVDQLEELLTLSEPGEARIVAAALAALAVRTSLVRVLATARSDFLSRLATLPGLDTEMARGLYFLRPLTGEHVREVIVRPAAAHGVTYESEALVDTLVEQTEHAPGGLPLLQFTLAELWDARDGSQTIRAASLAALGGVGGALSRHADRVLAGLAESEQDAARRILLRLVTTEGTRMRRAEAELITQGARRDSERAALEVLVRGRVLVANNAHDGAYELAHEALLASWTTLQGWLQRDAADHATRERIEQAATAWERMGRPRDLLWGRRQLAETRSLDPDSLAPREAMFLAASERALRLRWLLGVLVAAAVIVGAIGVGLAIRARAQRQLETVVAQQVDAATAAQRSARQIATQRDVAERRAFHLFDARRWPEGETAWTEVEAMAVREEGEYRRAATHLESALLLDPSRSQLRAWFADLTFERLLRAEHARHRGLADELTARMTTYDDGRHAAAIGAPARLDLTIVPAGAQVWLERPGSPRVQLGEAPLRAPRLAPGSVVLVVEAPGRAAAHLPILLPRGETVTARIELPPAAAAPAGMLFVPPGTFLFGSGDSSDMRHGFLNTVPLHEVSTPGYFIAQHEVSFADWIAFLDDLPVEERRRRTPSGNDVQSALTLTELAPRRWQLAMRPAGQAYVAETGQRLRYARRAVRAEQDWTRFPVVAVSYDDAVAYAAWLDRTGRSPGARLCDEYEWERAARGADGRTFPSGATLAQDDANIDATYGRDPAAFGPDEIGAHPASRSPVGADDMAGNVWELVRSVEVDSRPVMRGGSWYQGELSARSMNRSHTEATQRNPLLGLRLCATPR